MERRIDPLGTYSLAASTGFLEGFVPARLYAPGGGRPSASRLPGGHRGWRRRRRAYARGSLTTWTGPSSWRRSPTTSRPPRRRWTSSTPSCRWTRTDAATRRSATRDPAIGRLQARYPGLRPVLFHSPYEAAAWAVIGTRIAIRQAARVKSAMAERLGTDIEIHGETLHAFPTPAALATIEAFPGLFGRKTEYLRGIGAAAMAGHLRTTDLRARSEADALARLQELGGIGPFGAELTLLRGVGTTDRAPYEESRLGRASPSPMAATSRRATRAWRSPTAGGRSGRG